MQDRLTPIVEDGVRHGDTDERARKTRVKTCEAFVLEDLRNGCRKGLCEEGLISVCTVFPAERMLGPTTCVFLVSTAARVDNTVRGLYACVISDQTARTLSSSAFLTRSKSAASDSDTFSIRTPAISTKVDEAHHSQTPSHSSCYGVNSAVGHLVDLVG
jgi:hypothetical protein